VTSPSQKLNVKLHVSVPAEYTGGIPYDHDYVVQFQFDDSDI
ncbi:cell surface protein, partial [Paenibacillus polymyxa]